MQYKSLMRDVADVLFPRECAGCTCILNRGEQFICTRCNYGLPLTRYWNEPDNPVARMFWGRTYIEMAASFLYFYKGGKVQEIMHQLKYKGQKDIGLFLGKMYGNYLKQSAFNNTDVIIPVPLHSSKLKTRGYNQSEWLAKGIEITLGKQMLPDAVIRHLANESQTRKGRYERWENVENIFAVAKPEPIQGKHILLVDDVLTTGATIEACAQAILNVPGTKVSVATLAYAVK